MSQRRPMGKGSIDQLARSGRRRIVRTGLRVLGWGAVLTVVTYFFVRFGLPYFGIGGEPSGPGWPKRGWLLVHISGGGLALFMGPAQFWTGLRRKHLHIHRWTGRLYLTGVVVGTVTAVGLLPHVTFGWGWRVALSCMATVWFTTSAMAFLAILRGRTKAHKEWVVRSYVLTFQFVILRLLFEVPFIAEAGDNFVERVTTMVWVSWTMPLFFTEVILQWKRSIGSSAVARAKARPVQIS